MMSSVRHRLDTLSSVDRTRFACAIAERLLPAYSAVSVVVDPAELRAGLDLAWTLAVEPGSEAAVTAEVEGRLVDLYPDEDDGDYFASAIAQNAIGSVVFALCSSHTADADDAASAAEQLREAVDFAAGGEYESRVSTPVVQAGLRAIEDALQSIERNDSTADIRTRAKADGLVIRDLILASRPGHSER